MFEQLFSALPHVFALANFLAVVVGVIAGILVGALPGLSATMAISVLVPFTFGMDPLVALGMMAGIYNGAMYGGAIPAVLLRIPGTPAAVATTLDGYPMAQAGKGGYGLQVALVSSAIGSLASALALMLLAPPLAKLTLMFGPPEVFWIAIFGLTSIVFLVGGNVTKGLLSACFGVLLSLVGADSITGNDRFTWGNLHLLDGINVVVVLVGLYAMPPAISLLEEMLPEATKSSMRLHTESIWKAIPSMFGFWKTWVRGSIYGILVGILPGAGGSMAGFLSYNEARSNSKDPESFGKGNPEGIAASEVANNADTAAAMIPALTLGIPGTSVAAVMLGGMMIHGLQPGPMLFREHPDVVYGFMWQFLAAGILLFFLGGSLATNAFAQVLRLPRQLLGPIIMALMVVGVFMIHESMFDVYLMLGFGLIGYAMDRLKFPMAPVVLGLILGEFAEGNLRLALRMSRNDWSILWSRPICQIIIVFTVFIIVWPMIKKMLANRKRRGNSNLATETEK